MSALPGGLPPLNFSGSSGAGGGLVDFGDGDNIVTTGGSSMLRFLDTLSRRNPLMAAVVVIGGLFALGAGLGVLNIGPKRKRRR